MGPQRRPRQRPDPRPTRHRTHQEIPRSPEISQDIVRDIPTGRWGEPDEITGAAIYLAGDASKHTTGSCLTVDGGQTAHTGDSGMLDRLALDRLALGRLADT